jgi:enterochelin esterase-like enzyme
MNSNLSINIESFRIPFSDFLAHPRVWMRWLLLSVFLLVFSSCSSPEKSTAIDQFVTYQVTSTVAGIASRKVTILIPPGYNDAVNSAVRYPVLYMHDGQNCLDSDSYGHGGWKVHTVSYDLAARGLMRPVIIVMVNNTASRTAEFFPGAGTAPGATAEGYLDFLQNCVIPLVDAAYRTLPDAAHRAIGGSSYGGLISLYGGWTRPSLFGIVMAMSPILIRDNGTGAWTASYDFESLVTQKKALRIYIDSGTIFGVGDGDDGMARTAALAGLFKSRGWVLNTDLAYAVGQGHEHNESFWRKRLAPSTSSDAGVWPGALCFIFPPSS